MISFKKAIKADIPQIRELANQSWNAAYKKILSQEQIDYMLQQMYSHEEISKQLENPNYQYYLILKDNIAAGFIGFEFHYEKNTTKLHRIYLLEDFKGLGLGKAAINFLKEKTSETSNNRIILNVNKNNSAKQIYEKQGFTVYKEGVFDIGNGYVMDDFLMELHL
ncbi:GNAT family N-acetyltransferase [Kaistella montana]|uniref:GNAT family N-acetyltransferase n=1 Tax=Kaistella montana TaxID=1849733 RepID=A0ABW5K510_9FLAO|nr:GNAT family N-acetyltransferase [Kaistella montana]MCQ4034331.1 GNAT family N-acetyltransferase [Kaistella montana]